MNRCGTWNGIRLIGVGTMATLLFFGLFATGCATSTGNVREQTHKAITLTAETYDVLMSSLGALYKSGVIGNAERDKAVDYANTFRAAALKIATGADDGEFEKQIQIMQDMIKKLRDLLARAGVADAGEIIEPLEQMARNAGTTEEGASR